MGPLMANSYFRRRPYLDEPTAAAEAPTNPKLELSSCRYCAGYDRDIPNPQILAVRFACHPCQQTPATLTGA